MKYLPVNRLGMYVADGEKQQLRRARRRGETTHRQQKKALVIHRRELKAMAA